MVDFKNYFLYIFSEDIFLYFCSNSDATDNVEISVNDCNEQSEDEVSDPDFPPEQPARPRGRARGRGQHQQRPARGRGRGRGRGALPPPAPGGAGAASREKSYDDPDIPNQIPPFNSRRQPGLHLNLPVLRGAMTRAVDFFKLFFTAELVRTICTHTNSYA